MLLNIEFTKYLNNYHKNNIYLGIEVHYVFIKQRYFVINIKTDPYNIPVIKLSLYTHEKKN